MHFWCWRAHVPLTLLNALWRLMICELEGKLIFACWFTDWSCFRYTGKLEDVRRSNKHLGLHALQMSSVSIIQTHLDSTFFFYHRDSVFGWTQCSNYTVFICFTSSNSLNNIAIIVLQLHQLLGALMSPITPSSVVYCAAYYIVTMICTCIYEHLVLLTVRSGCLRSVFVYFFVSTEVILLLYRPVYCLSFRDNIRRTSERCIDFLK